MREGVDELACAAVCGFDQADNAAVEVLEG